MLHARHEQRLLRAKRTVSELQPNAVASTHSLRFSCILTLTTTATDNACDNVCEPASNPHGSFRVHHQLVWKPSDHDRHLHFSQALRKLACVCTPRQADASSL